MKNYDKLSQSPLIDLPFKRVIVLMMENQTYDRLLGFVDGVETKDLKHYFQKSSINPETKIFCTPNADPLKDHSWDPPHGHDDIVKLMWGMDKSKWPWIMKHDENFIDPTDINFDRNQSKKVDVLINTNGDNPQNNSLCPPTGNEQLIAFIESYKKEFPCANKEELKAVEHKYMACFKDNSLPALHKLAKEFVTLNNYYSSVPGPTGPNRLFAHCGSSGGYCGGSWTTDTGLRPHKKMKTIFELLDEKTLTKDDTDNNFSNWKVYGDTSLNTAASFPYVKRRADTHVKLLGEFIEDCRSHNPKENPCLPKYCWLVPEYGSNSQHPATYPHSDGMICGDNLIAEVFDAIRGNEVVWNESLFIVTYDEGGGFMDSKLPYQLVNPPKPCVDPESWAPKESKMPGYGNFPYNFRFLGTRVPCILISPWLNKKLDTTLCEHASIVKFLLDLFTLKNDETSASAGGYLTTRVRDSGDFISILKNAMCKEMRQNIFKKLPRSKIPVGVEGQKVAGYPGPLLSPYEYSF